MTSETYVTVECGSQCFKTGHVRNTDNEPLWDQKTFLFVCSETTEESQIKLSVLDKDLVASSHLGTGYLALKEAFGKCREEARVQLDVALQAVPIASDRGLKRLTLLEDDKQFEEWGDLEVELKLTPRVEVEQGFYETLVQTVDTNHNGIIDRDEANGMFTALGFEPLDGDLEMKMDKDQVIRLLSDAEIQHSDLFIQCMALYLNGDIEDDWNKHLMSGVTEQHQKSRRSLKIKDRATGLIVQEHIPKYVDWALRLVYDNKLNRHIVRGKMAHAALAKGSRSKGASMDLEKSAADIPGFVKQHNLDTTTLYKPVEEFKTFNDFFARGIKVDEFRPLADPDDESVVVSPADCRMMVWDTILDATKVWIKGSKFTLENLLGPNSKVDLPKYEGGSFAIARLAPQDYHRWHYPIGGKVVNIEHIDGALYTVNPIAINKTVDVYTENKRAIVEIDSGNNGSCVVFSIAATMVGSYTLFKEEAADPTKDNPVPLKVGDEVKRGEVAGEFRFGGSTVLLLFEPNKVKWSDDIQRNVSSKFETLLTARSRIGKIQ